MPKPMPGHDEVLVKTIATTVTTGDWRIKDLIMPKGFTLLSRLLFGFFVPRQGVLGTELAGIVEAVGNDVKQFKPGDHVIGVCGMGLGCHAEYRCFKANGIIAHKPEFLSFEEAAALPFGGLTALSYLRDKAKIKPGERVLVHGASGSVGLAAVQLSKYFGAKVTAVCSRFNFELVQALGADQMIDYAHEDFLQNNQTYDIIFDAYGSLSFLTCKDSLSQSGRLLLVSAGLSDLFTIPLVSLTGKKRLIAGPAEETVVLLKELLDLAASQKFKVVIDRYYPFDAISDAYAYVANRHRSGNVVIQIVK
jgi:NADPH:quinone reductase-like Zn-dependent oxidoreductase